jgi:hypothetical protein
VIDYVWYTGANLSLNGVLGEVDKGYLEKVVGFPNAHFPSEYVFFTYAVQSSRTDLHASAIYALLASFEWNHLEITRPGHHRCFHRSIDWVYDVYIIFVSLRTLVHIFSYTFWPTSVCTLSSSYMLLPCTSYIFLRLIFEEYNARMIYRHITLVESGFLFDSNFFLAFDFFLVPLFFSFCGDSKQLL